MGTIQAATGTLHLAPMNGNNVLPINIRKISCHAALSFFINRPFQFDISRDFPDRRPILQFAIPPPSSTPILHRLDLASRQLKVAVISETMYLAFTH
jgi:hypothetical protein